MALAGMVFGGRYELVGLVGNGGYCEVWRGTDTLLSRPVAVKLLHPGYAGKAEPLARFRAEARHAGALLHQNITRVYDYGEPAGGPPYLVIELVDGPSLEDVLASGPLDARLSMDVIAQVAEGLQVAHDAGLVHRDVKPANLLLASGGIVKITDFGVAHALGSAAVTPTGEMMGTPGYHAPEQVTGAQATPASDLYALGVVAYECLAGARPFTGSAVEMAVAHRDRPLPPLPPSVPADISALVADLTAKDPARRPASAAEVALRAALLRDGRQAATSGGPHPVPDGQAHALAIMARDVRSRRGRRPRLALAVTVLTGFAGLVLATLIGFAPAWHAVRVPWSPPSAQPPGTGTPARNAGGQASIPDTPATPATPVAPAAQPPAPAGPAAVSSAPAPAPPSHSPPHGRGHGHGNGNGNGNGNS